MPYDPIALLTQRNGPSLGPGDQGSAPLAGGAPPSPGGDDAGGGGMLPQILQQIMGQQAQGKQQGGGDFLTKQIDNMRRLIAVIVVHTQQSHPEVARHMNSAWRSVDAALNSAQKAGTTNPTPNPGPSLGFSGANPVAPSVQGGRM